MPCVNHLLQVDMPILPIVLMFEITFNLFVLLLIWDLEMDFSLKIFFPIYLVLIGMMAVYFMLVKFGKFPENWILILVGSVLVGSVL